MQRKPFKKFNTHLWFLKKTLQKAGKEGTYHNTTEAINDKPTANGWKTESISSKIRNKISVPTLTTSIQHSFRILVTAIREEKEIKGIQIGKEVKLSLFADDLTLYIENPKDSTRKLLELINEYSKVAGYKINMQKSLAFLYTNNEKTKREIKETIPFTIATKRIKY